MRLTPAAFALSMSVTIMGACSNAKPDPSTIEGLQAMIEARGLSKADSAKIKSVTTEVLEEYTRSYDSRKSRSITFWAKDGRSIQGHWDLTDSEKLKTLWVNDGQKAWVISSNGSARYLTEDEAKEKHKNFRPGYFLANKKRRKDIVWRRLPDAGKNGELFYVANTKLASEPGEEKRDITEYYDRETLDMRWWRMCIRETDDETTPCYLIERELSDYMTVNGARVPQTIITHHYDPQDSDFVSYPDTPTSSSVEALSYKINTEIDAKYWVEPNDIRPAAE